MTLTASQWQDKIRRLHEDHHALEGNFVFDKLMEECVLRAGFCDRTAGTSGSDRDMNRAHGKAEAFREVSILARELVRELDVFYRQQMEEEQIEEGSTGNNGSGAEGGTSPDTAPPADRSRLTYPGLRNKEADR